MSEKSLYILTMSPPYYEGNNDTCNSLRHGLRRQKNIYRENEKENKVYQTHDLNGFKSNNPYDHRDDAKRNAQQEYKTPKRNTNPLTTLEFEPNRKNVAEYGENGEEKSCLGGERGERREKDHKHQSFRKI